MADGTPVQPAYRRGAADGQRRPAGRHAAGVDTRRTCGQIHMGGNRVTGAKTTLFGRGFVTKPGKSWLAAAAWVAVVLCARPSTGEAQEYDHLECYRTRELRRGAWSANAHLLDVLSLTPDPRFAGNFSDHSGCRIKGTQPTEICTPVVKSPSEAPAGPNLTNRLACYAMVCPAPSGHQDITLTNQFGSGTATLRQAATRRKKTVRSLCVPIEGALR